MINQHANGDLQNDETFLAIRSGSSAFRKFWDENNEKIDDRIVIDLKNSPKSGEKGLISRIHGTNNFKVQIRTTSDIDRNAYRLAHEICHGLIFIQGYPRCEIPRWIMTVLKSKNSEDILHDLPSLCEGLNSLIYDPFVNHHLDAFGFNLQNIYLKSSHEIPPYSTTNLNEYQEANLGFRYSLMKIELSKYCPTELKKSTYLSWFETYCSHLIKDWLEIVQIVEKCDYCSPDVVKNCILTILNKYRLKGTSASYNYLFIQPKENLHF